MCQAIYFSIFSTDVLSVSSSSSYASLSEGKKLTLTCGLSIARLWKRFARFNLKSSTLAAVSVRVSIILRESIQSCCLFFCSASIVLSSSLCLVALFIRKKIIDCL